MLWAKPTYFEIPSWAPLHTDLSCQNRGWDKDVVQRSAGRGSREPIEVQMQKKKKDTLSNFQAFTQAAVPRGRFSLSSEASCRNHLL